MRYCTQCGTALRTEYAFCTRCGSSLGPPAPEPGPPTAAWASAGESSTRSQPPVLSHTLELPGNGHAADSSWLFSSVGGQAGTRDDLQPPSGCRDRGKPAGHVGLLIAVAVVVLVIGGGAAVTWGLHKGNANHGTAAVSARSERPGVASPGSASQAPRTSGTQNADRGMVAVAPAAGQEASAPKVAAFLAAYFEAINARDYQAYLSLFEPVLRPTYQQFQNGYESTSDSSVMLAELVPTAVGFAATVSFTSHQEAADSVTRTSCTLWGITLYLKPHGDTYIIVPPPANYRAHYQTC
jgi:hypothetical protein